MAALKLEKLGVVSEKVDDAGVSLDDEVGDTLGEDSPKLGDAATGDTIVQSPYAAWLQTVPLNAPLLFEHTVH
ncbi:MAG: hypothetical protein KME30_31260 [Iphinoe sp. HA4291-MV1]|nr:hypothetical protein [Iphinoe sp. HA4291-MV1]